MNRKHIYIAMAIAPFLAAGSYVATGFYVDKDAPPKALVQLERQGKCHLSSGDCHFYKHQLTLDLASDPHLTHVNLVSSHHLQGATFTIVVQGRESQRYIMQRHPDLMHWQADISSLHLSEKTTLPMTLRFSALQAGVYYLSEVSILP